jgi:hypothetical protein
MTSLVDPNIGQAIFFIMFAASLALMLALTPDEKPKRRPPWG